MLARASRFPGVSAYFRILLVRTYLLGGGTGLSQGLSLHGEKEHIHAPSHIRIRDIRVEVVDDSTQPL